MRNSLRLTHRQGNILAFIAALLITLSGASSYAENAEDLKQKGALEPPYSPYVGHRFPMRPLFGDTHLHTSQSFDAIAFGTVVGPEQAYQFARGEEVISSTGLPARLSRPLDFLVVADHAENMGTMGEMLAGNPAVMGDARVRKWHDWLKNGGADAMKVYHAVVASITGTGEPLPAVLINEDMTRYIWEKNIGVAQEYNDPGYFTALIGYEWSSNTGGNNLHRVVIYRDGAERVAQTLPFSSVVSDNPEDLWDELAAYEDKTGGRVLAIPHNGNLSNGTMFPLINPESGHPITKAYAHTRSEFEPLYEITQIKGDAEAHPVLSPNDEFADYETWDRGNLTLSVAKQDDMLQYEYARAALKNGMKVESRLGVNPFKLGLIGSTDSHTGLAAVAEENFFGKLPHMEPAKDRTTREMVKFGDNAYMGPEMVASGYAAVWATENTREAIWDAMKRREVYATTGPRIALRLFGGWDFKPEHANNPALANIGYAKGVPMGGDLTKAAGGQSPTFLIAALRDPIGANLDRIQIIKGWLNEDGETQERIYDVAVSDGRTINAEGRAKTAVGSTVNVESATWSNSIGAGELKTVWTDPDFNPSLRAFYYVRAIEIPTPRWTTYDAVRFKTSLPATVPMTTQERAYTSPIWYTP
jgi:hypothetical protein